MKPWEHWKWKIHTSGVWFAENPVKEQHYITRLLHDTLSISYCGSPVLLLLSKTFGSVHVWHIMWYILYFIGQRGHRSQRLAFRLEALSSQVQRLSRERDNAQLTQNPLSLLLQGYFAFTIHIRRRGRLMADIFTQWVVACIFVFQL